MMKTKKSTKIVACLLAITFLNSLFFPTVSYALTSGVSQSEFGGFESFGNTDMVNLSTGDLTYNIPILSIPATNGSFSLPLSYHSGINLEQEASWVGLGWSLNPGSISRTVSQFPDDYSGEILENHYENSGGSGYTLNYGGIYEKTVDSEKGMSGSVGLSEIFRLGFGNNNGFTVMGVKSTDTWHTINWGSVSNSIQTVLGMMGSVSQSVKNGNSLASSVGMQIVGQSIFNYAWQGFANHGSYSNTANINNWTHITDKKGSFRTEYEYYLDYSNWDYMLGSLYLGDHFLPSGTNSNANVLFYEQDEYQVKDELNGGYGANATVPQFAHFQKRSTTVNPTTLSRSELYSDADNFVSDMHYYHGSDYGASKGPTSIAYDSYNVSGNGVSGSISPMRHDVGSLSYPGEHNGISLNAVPFTPTEHDYSDAASATASKRTKTPFYYKGEVSNRYDHHIGTAGSMGSSTQFGMSTTTETAPASNSDVNAYFPNFIVEDDILKASSTNHKEADRTDNTLLNNELVKGRRVEWFTNGEISAGYADDFIHESRDRSSLPQKGIGGFKVIAADGTTYHYALPVYNKYKYSKSAMADRSNYSSGTMDGDYAKAWLLTAITGSDFVDRNDENGDPGSLGSEDFGYWVKLDYGMFSDGFRWSFPYSGYREGESGDGSGYFSEGVKETWYLNTISTNEYTALFVKDVREDGRDKYDDENDEASSSLYLESIVLLKNDDYEELVEPLSSGGQEFVFSEEDDSDLRSTDSRSGVIDVDDFTSAQTTFVNSKQVNKYVFNYDYSLCQSVPNSFSSATDPPDPDVVGSSGKLTLRSLEALGRNNQKLIPDYDFTYSSNNPNYDKDKWDGWGMYSPDGDSQYDTHNNTSSVGDNWHLSEISLPTGANIEIDYERDVYSNVSGDAVEVTLDEIISDSNGGSDIYELNGKSLECIFDIGESITLDVKIEEWSPGVFGQSLPSLVNTTYLTGTYTIQDVSGSYITISDDILADNTPLGITNNEFIVTCYINNEYTGECYGGDVRVSDLSVSDEFNNSHNTKYIYTQDESENGKSSGVIAKEPAYIRSLDNLPDYYNYYDYPETPVMYGKVTVLNNYISNTEFQSKQVFEFITPHKDMVSVNSVAVGLENENVGYTGQSGTNSFMEYYFKRWNFDVTVNTSQIGLLKSVATFNGFDESVSETIYEYAEGSEFNDIGLYTEGSLFNDVFVGQEENSGFVNNATFYNIFRTTKQYNSTVPKAVTFKDNYSEKRVENTKFDYLTGAVLETEYYDAWGAKYKTKNVPAYTLAEYSDMGSKVVNSSNKNMMSQMAGQYLYSYNEDGTLDVVNASINTWNKDWIYREISSSGGNSSYSDASYNDEVYRTHKNYVWKSELNDDGTYASFTDFDHTNRATNTGWQKTSEVTQYDHFSRVLESEDINGDKAATKYDASGSFNLFSSANANYSEIFFSSFELDPVNNLLSDNLYFNASSSAFSTDYAHTGSGSLKITGVEGVYANMDISNHETFIVSAWVHVSNWADANLVAKFYENENTATIATLENSGSTINQFKAGDWYLLSMEIPLANYSNADRMVVSVENRNSSPIYIDDFKLTPFESAGNCHVYDSETYKVVAILDDQHLATAYEYDDNGVLKTVKQEVIDTPTLTGGFKTVQEHFYNYGKNN